MSYNKVCLIITILTVTKVKEVGRIIRKLIFGKLDVLD
jgi:hypothetical protein